MPATSGTVQVSASDQARLRAKTRLFTGIVVVSNVAGNSALTHGMKQLGDIGNSPLALIAALFHPWVALGVALLILWTLTHMALLSWADLSYVLPVTAIGYVLTALSGEFLLGEVITTTHWAGILLITAGVTLVGMTAHTTAHESTACETAAHESTERRTSS
jgi:drug/metabolite transporter (DMT)-like permease